LHFPKQIVKEKKTLDLFLVEEKKIFFFSASYFRFLHQKENLQKPHAKVKKTKEEMQASLVNIRKLVVESPKNALKMKN
jgi:hypothetical protein